MHTKSTGNVATDILIPIVPGLGFAGDNKNKTINPITESQFKDFTFSWLPSATFAKAWLAFIKGDLDK